MSKELEDKKYYLDVVDNLEFAEMYFEANEMKSLVEYLFTPPTAEEVCKALSETILEGYGQVEWKYIDDDFITTVNDDEHGIGVIYLSECKLFKFPPHLITLIGRFYEGLGK